MRKRFPSPLWSVALFALWIALAQSVTAGQVLLGLVIAIAVPALTTSFRPVARLRRPGVIVRFILSVAHDVIVSGLRVAAGVVTWQRRPPRSQFVVIPLELRDPVGLAALAMVTTVVPGTVWSELAVDRSVLRLHVWDVDDAREFVAHYKARYEAPLRAIFE